MQKTVAAGVLSVMMAVAAGNVVAQVAGSTTIGVSPDEVKTLRKVDARKSLIFRNPILRFCLKNANLRQNPQTEPPGTGSVGRLRCTSGSQRREAGKYQFSRPSTTMVAGTSTERTRVASSSTAMASPKPIC